MALCTATSWTVWAAYAADYVTRLVLVSNRRR